MDEREPMTFPYEYEFLQFSVDNCSQTMLVRIRGRDVAFLWDRENRKIITHTDNDISISDRELTFSLISLRLMNRGEMLWMNE